MKSTIKMLNVHIQNKKNVEPTAVIFKNYFELKTVKSPTEQARD